MTTWRRTRSPSLSRSSATTQKRFAAFTVAVLLLTAACGSSPKATTPATVTGAATASSASGTPTATYSATAGTTSTPGTGTATATSTPAPTAPIPSSLLGHVVSRIPTSRRIVALTFDAGANGDGVDSIQRHTK